MLFGDEDYRLVEWWYGPSHASKCTPDELATTAAKLRLEIVERAKAREAAREAGRKERAAREAPERYPFGF